MSAKKGFEVDTNTDSGFLSGPIDQYPEALRDEAETQDCDVKVKSESSVNVDSGLDVESVRPEQSVLGAEGSSLKCELSVECFDSGLDVGLPPLEPDQRAKVTEPSHKCETKPEYGDSGLDLGLSGCLEVLRFDEEEESKVPLPTVTVELTDIPPVRLFEQDDDGDTQLHIAAVHDCERSVSTLIRVCPDIYWLDVPNDYGHTALHLAVMSNHAVVTRMLVKAGASLGVRDLKGNTPLHAATAAQHVECLQALLIPIDGNQRQTKLAAILNQKNYDGKTCVHLAATSGHIPTMQTLLYYGADIHAREGLAGWTALHIAARRGDMSLAMYLVEKYPSITRVRDYASRTARRIAKRSPALSSADYQRLFRTPSEDSDSESESEDEYDSDDGESLFEKLKGSFSVASVATN